MENTPPLSPTESSEDEFAAEAVETLVAGRERRKTAGNRYDRSIVLEEVAGAEDQDEVTLLFADNEEEEDEEFNSGEEDEDAEMSSSDDDDQGPNAAGNDLEGEQELQKQAKVERVKKRKADLALTTVAGMRKKLKTDPTRSAAVATAPKPSKKKERVTWVHDEESGRSSLRKQTIAHRAETIARLKESEAQSRKLKAIKEKRDRDRAKVAPKELTQADRLAEAARIERQNAKSLNRWEATEKKRQEEQAAKLAALKNRQLNGPVVTWLSQKAKWSGSKMSARDAAEPTELKKRGRKSRAELERMAAERLAESSMPVASRPNIGTTTSVLMSTGTATPALPPTLAQSKPAPPQAIKETMPTSATLVEDAQPQNTSRISQEPEDSFLKGIHEYANLLAEDSNASRSKRVSPALQDMDAQQDTDMWDSPLQHTEEHSEQQQNPGSPFSELADPKVRTIASTNRVHIDLENTITKSQAVPFHAQVPTQLPSADQQRVPPSVENVLQTPIPLIVELVSEPPIIEEDSTRNLVILEKFDELAGDSRQQYSFFYNKKISRPGKAVKHSQELCPITTLPVRYRDPSTGIAYANTTAYKKLHELKEHKFVWSSMLGCYIGRENAVAARGVPEGWV